MSGISEYEAGLVKREAYISSELLQHVPLERVCADIAENKFVTIQIDSGSAKLSAEVKTQLFDRVASCTSVTFFYYWPSHDSNMHEEVARIIPVLERSTSIKSLELSAIVTGSDLVPLFQFPSLTSLSFKLECRSNTEDATLFADCIARSTTITSLSIPCVYLPDDENLIRTLSDGFARNTSITDLTLSANHFSPVNAQMMEGIANMASLKKFSLWGSLGGTSYLQAAFATMLPRITNIESAVIPLTCEDRSAERIAAGIAANTSLKSLVFDASSALDSAAAGRLGEAILHHPALTELGFRVQSSEDLVPFCHNIAGNKTLKSLLIKF